MADFCLNLQSVSDFTSESLVSVSVGAVSRASWAEPTATVCVGGSVIMSYPSVAKQHLE